MVDEAVVRSLFVIIHFFPHVSAYVNLVNVNYRKAILKHILILY